MALPKTIRNLIAKSLLENLSQAEQQKLNNWIEQSEQHYKTYHQLKERWKSGEAFSDWEAIDLQQNWNEILVKADQHVPRKVQLFPILRYAAAAAILIFYIFYFLGVDSDTLITNTGRKPLVVELPDQSKVWLKPKAQLTFDEASFDKSRDIALSGEAFFEVEKDPRPFIVTAGDTKVEVLGTSFNVISEELTTDVLLIEGSVKFSSKQNAEILSPGHSARFEEGLVRRTDTTYDLNKIGWKTGKFSFSNTPLGQVMEQVKAYYGIEIEIETEKKQLLVTTDIDQLSLKEFIEELRFILELEVEVDGSTLTVR